jgi:hypothetical protein
MMQINRYHIKIYSRLSLFIFFIFTIALLSEAQLLERPPQYILISFDGSYTNEMWKATREVAVKNQAKVTHFISGVDFLIGSTRGKIPGSTDHIYTPPRYSGGRRSDIGFGGTKEMLEERLRQIMLSIASGMEIGSHANAHFNGSDWTVSEWTYEFDWFHKLVLEVFSINNLSERQVGFSEVSWQSLLKTQMKSFRAPYLGRGEGLWGTLGQSKWSMLGKHQYTYDASDVTRNTSAWPERSQYGFWYFRMATIPVPELGRNILSMDYNFYVAHSDNPNDPKDKPELVDRFEEQMYQAYINWFFKNYYGNRAPINIGHHFSTWNRGAYWKALQRFMRDVCTQPEVVCANGQELVAYLQTKSRTELTQLSLGQFDRSRVPNIEIVRKFPVRNLSKNVNRAYPYQSQGRAYIPNSLKDQASVYWYLRFQEKKIWADAIDLKSLAESGVTRVDLVAADKKGNQLDIMKWEIVWDIQLGEWRLERAFELNDERKHEQILGCTPEAHQEVIDESLLNKLISI